MATAFEQQSLQTASPSGRAPALLFEQQPRESAKAFAAFRAYLELGPERSLAAVGEKLGKSKVMMEKWSRKFDWPSRVAAHGAHVALVERQAIEALAREKAIDWYKVFEEQKVSEWRARCRLVTLANKLVDRFEANEKRCGTPEGIARLYELASKLGRLASGMPSDIKEVKTTVTGTIDVEWEIALKKVYGGSQGQAAGGGGTVVDVEAKAVAPAALPPEGGQHA